jgi:hypothetical protein
VYLLHSGYDHAAGCPDQLSFCMPLVPLVAYSQ